MSGVFSRWQVLRRFEDTRVVTEQGVYADGQVPADYGGFELRVKVTQRLLLTNTVGEIMELRLDSTEDLLDSENKTGLGLKFDYDFSNPLLTETILPVGPSTKSVDTTASYWHYMDAATEARAIEMFNHMILDGGD